MKIEWETCFKVGISVFLLYLCIEYWKVLADFVLVLFGASAPLIIGGVIAYIVNILMSFYERHYFAKSTKRGIIKSRRPVCMLGAFITFVAVIFLLARLIIPQLVSCIELIFAELPGFMNYLVDLVMNNETLTELMSEDTLSSIASIDWQSRIGQIVKVLTSGIGDVVSVLISTVTSVFSWIVTAFLSIIFAFYLLLDKEHLKSQVNKLCKRYLKEKWRQQLKNAFLVLNDCFHKYIVGQCLEAVILGVLCTIGMWIFRLPYAPMIGALIAFTALIPIAGAYIGAIVGAFMIFMVSPIKALIFLIFIIVLQQIEGNLIYPRVVGSSMGLPGLWVLAAVTVGGGVMGIPGMLLGVPIVAAIYRFLREEANKVPLAEQIAAKKAKAAAGTQESAVISEKVSKEAEQPQE